MAEEETPPATPEAEAAGKGYDPKAIEAYWVKTWEEAQVFRADARSSKPAFSMAIPPPNITGSLHMGHALTFSIEDLVTRYQRMRGFNTLWLPGSDHAGIATQTVVERELKKEGLDRQTLGREKFLERVWQWKAKSGTRITEQMRTLGCSVDWSREHFTLDPELSKTVRHVFVRLFEEGLIYRAQRLINWCPGCLTAISDLEVNHEDRQGKLWQIGYKVEGSDEVLPVATTRPETLLGDTGIAVHPDDERYQHLIGKRALVPLVNRWVPIVGDAILVNRDFGTGVVKITPGHDFNDFEAGRRNHLEVLSIFDERAKVNELGGPYQGLDRFVARKKILADLQAQELLLKTDDHKLAIATCQRSGDVVEPRLSWQWFVQIEPLAKPAIAAVEDGHIRFVPESWTATYYHWMHNIHDWCISRQLWWGHQIPAWYCDCGEVTVSETTPTACAKCGSNASLRQDSDVLDTWFSSALWPFSTLGWPEKTADFETFYPTTLMETGSDILFFWVARMIMMGLKFTGKAPFRDVYLHSIVRDGQGEKMSKTKGNVIDPLDVTQEYGADALRFSLLSQTGQGRDIKLSLERVAVNRAFANKIWNAARFGLMHLGDFTVAERNAPPVAAGMPERWIRSRLAAAAAELKLAMEEYRFSQATVEIYAFVWNDVCDWYIELAKLPLQGSDPAQRRSAQRALCDALDGALRLLHPFMPFVTEEIWQKLPRLEGDPKFLCLAAMPDDVRAAALRAVRDPEAEREMELLQSVIGAVRNLRGEINIGPGKRLVAIVRTASAELRQQLTAQKDLIELLAQLSELRIEAPGPKVPSTAAKILPELEVLVPLTAGIVDFAVERARLGKEIEKAGKDFELISRKLETPSFIERAPADVIAKDRARLVELTSRIEELRGYQQVLGQGLGDAS